MNFIQPLSTLTNLAFIAVGIQISKSSWYAGTCVIVLGVASLLYHSEKTRALQHFDVIMIYFVFLALLDWHLGGHFTVIAFVLGCLMATYHTSIPSHPMIGLLGLAVLVTLLVKFPVAAVLPVIGFFALWGLLNIPYLHDLGFSRPVVDFLHALTHLAAARGIYEIMNL